MNKQKKVIDIFPPKKVMESYDFPIEHDARKERQEKKETNMISKFDSKLHSEINKSDFAELKPERKKGKHFWKVLSLVFIFLVGSAVFLHFVAARVNLQIWPQTSDLNLDEQVTIDANSQLVDFASATVPGKIFETEKLASQNFNATGKVAKEDYARGTIRVYNNYSSSQTLVQNTRFQPALDRVIYFRSVKTVVVPAKGYLDIEVKADRTGEEYNIEPATFSVPGLAGLPQYYSVYAKSFSKMTGGIKGEANQVTDDDLTSARKALSDSLRKQAKDDFAGQTHEDFIFLDNTISEQILQASSSFPAGQQADSFNFTLKIKIKALAFKKSDLDEFVKELIASKMQGTGKKVQEQSLKMDYSVAQANLESGKIILDVKISAKTYADIKEESVKNAILGKSIKESQALLENQPTIVKSSFSVFPPWLRDIPQDGAKIRVNLNID